MYRTRLPLAALVLSLLAACQAAAPTAPVPPEPAAHALFDADSILEDARGGNLLGSGN
ncbi:MAG TPA: hypothetical protein VHG51_09060 [Longimicrobiaceae bacterium]|nr:hypothetical protein [Longimicrobiaceae bacterium]